MHVRSVRPLSLSLGTAALPIFAMRPCMHLALQSQMKMQAAILLVHPQRSGHRCHSLDEDPPSSTSIPSRHARPSSRWPRHHANIYPGLGGTMVRLSLRNTRRRHEGAPSPFTDYVFSFGASFTFTGHWREKLRTSTLGCSTTSSRGMQINSQPAGCRMSPCNTR